MTIERAATKRGEAKQLLAGCTGRHQQRGLAVFAIERGRERAAAAAAPGCKLRNQPRVHAPSLQRRLRATQRTQRSSTALSGCGGPHASAAAAEQREDVRRRPAAEPRARIAAAVQAGHEKTILAFAACSPAAQSRSRVVVDARGQ